jgi:diacylglycerol kinase (ATP)
MKNQAFKNRMSFALAGICTAVKRESSLKTQLGFAVAALLALLIFQPALLWWALVIVMIALVLAAELFNTAIEGVCDHVSPEQHPQIGYIKDVAAGAVWLLSLAAAIVGVLMLLSCID